MSITSPLPADVDRAYRELEQAVTARPLRNAGQISREFGMPVEDVSSFMSCLRIEATATARAIVRAHLGLILEGKRQPLPPVVDAPLGVLITPEEAGHAADWHDWIFDQGGEIPDDERELAVRLRSAANRA